MTVEEARKKMCPWIFMSYFMPGNIRGETPCNSCCQGSECMAWRWHEEFITDHQCETFLNEDGRLEYKPRPMLSKTDGYCGLAGKEGAE